MIAQAVNGLSEYRHVACGHNTSVATVLAEDYGHECATFGTASCAWCGSKFAVIKDGVKQFEWLADGAPIGKFVGG